MNFRSGAGRVSLDSAPRRHTYLAAAPAPLASQEPAKVPGAAFRSQDRMRMNTANLQLEGFYVVLAALLEAMCEKGLFQQGELEALLTRVESKLSEDSNRPAEMRDSNIEAICFPVRFLRQALRESSQGSGVSFADVALRVGQEKKERR
jgi:hypothetical protein